MTQWGLDTLFNPAKRHMDEEKRRLQATREQLGDSSGGRRIDLESGKVTIRRAARPGEEGPDSAPDESGTGEPAAGSPEIATAGDGTAQTGTAPSGPVQAGVADDDGAASVQRSAPEPGRDESTGAA